ncbi:glycosyltransferase involved in cell wall biosynthesis [Paraburkholderia atlantica]|uniref:glycosyltransferase family 2 protein n=1 Tax=Paraburkholderia atlantica TaxID=2654982 RepID=UPI003D233979
MPAISLVVPCFNQGAYIAETLDSVLLQSFVDWECIIVNDGSTDDSQTIIDQYAKKDHRFRPFPIENGGLPNACNFGFARARGWLFVPLDSDDRIHPDFLKRAAEVFDSHPDTALVHCKTKRFGETNYGACLHIAMKNCCGRT